MDADAQARLISSYAAALVPFDEAVGKVRDSRIQSRRGPGAWSVTEIIHHVADAEVIAAGRLRMLLARDGVHIFEYNEEQLVRASDPRKRSIDESLALIRALHAANLALLKSLRRASWEHSGLHEQDGRYGLDTWVERRVTHLRAHAGQLLARMS